MKYNYSIERKTWENKQEILSISGADSFDEAIKAVEKGVYERELKEKEKEILYNSKSEVIGKPEKEILAEKPEEIVEVNV